MTSLYYIHSLVLSSTDPEKHKAWGNTEVVGPLDSGTVYKCSEPINAGQNNPKETENTAEPLRILTTYSFGFSSCFHNLKASNLVTGHPPVATRMLLSPALNLFRAPMRLACAI